MKKNSIIVFLFLFVLSLTSCGKKEVNEMNLTKDFIVTSTPVSYTHLDREFPLFSKLNIDKSSGTLAEEM